MSVFAKVPRSSIVPYLSFLTVVELGAFLWFLNLNDYSSLKLDFYVRQKVGLVWMYC